MNNLSVESSDTPSPAFPAEPSPALPAEPSEAFPAEPSEAFPAEPSSWVNVRFILRDDDLTLILQLKLKKV